MKSGFALLKDKVCNNKLSEALFNSVLKADQTDIVQKFDRVLSQRIATYATSVEDISSEEEAGPDSRFQVIDHLVETVPTFLFRLALDWDAVAEDTRSGRNLFLAVLSSLIWRDSDSPAFIDAFIADVDPTADIKALNAQLIQKAEGDAPVPKKVFADFLALLKFPVSVVDKNDLPEQIENLYCFEALSQFLLTWYFDLLCQAETDTVTGYVHVIFLRLFATIQKREQVFWESYPDTPDLRQSLLESVGADDPDGRHPLLRKTAFKSIQLHNPLLIPPGEGSSAVFINRFNQRLSAFVALSPMGAALLLDTLMMLRGPGPAELIAECLYVENRPGFDQLQSFIQAKQQAHQALYNLLNTVAERKPVQRSVAPQSEPAHTAMTGAMTRDEVGAYLKERMLKTYETVRPEGALPQDQVSEYLASLSGDIAGCLAGGSMDRSGVAEFIRRVEPEIKEMASLGILAGEEKESFRDQFCRQAEFFSETYEADEEKAETHAEPVTETDEDPFLTQEIIPIGFEKGAPKISLGVFFRFPFLGMDGSTQNPFSQHLAYLETAVEQSALESEQLADIRSRLDEIPKTVYRKTYDVFPLDSYDETVMLIVFSLWRNNALDNLLA